jgi:hypothetical protein
MKFLQNAAMPLEAQPPDAAAASSNQSEIVRRLLKTRAMLQESRNRSAELQNALERFKYEQSKIAGR